MIGTIEMTVIPMIMTFSRQASSQIIRTVLGSYCKNWMVRSNLYTHIRTSTLNIQYCAIIFTLVQSQNFPVSTSVGKHIISDFYIFNRSNSCFCHDKCIRGYAKWIEDYISCVATSFNDAFQKG